MLTLDDIDNRQTREKVKKLREIFPWASVMRCRDTLLGSGGNVNAASSILSEATLELSDDQKVASQEIRSPIELTESAVMPSHALGGSSRMHNDEVLQLPSLPTHGEHSIFLQAPAITAARGVIEVTLPGSLMLTDLRETGAGVFEIPANTRFSTLTMHANTSIDISSLINDGIANAELRAMQAKYGELQARYNQMQEKLDRTLSTSNPISSNTSNPGSASYASHPIDHSNAAPTSNSKSVTKLSKTKLLLEISEMRKASTRSFWDSEPSKHPFRIHEQRTPWEERKLQFTAAAIMKAAIPPPSCHSRVDSAIAGFEMDIGLCTPTFKKFDSGINLFNLRRPTPLDPDLCCATTWGQFQPVPWKSPSNTREGGYLQFINALPPYKRYSFEELRVGDYIRGRTKAPHRFSLFPKLPAELRTMIWRFAQDPRVVELRFHFQGGLASRCWSPCRVPTLLHVCCESRQETLRSCQPSFGLPNHEARIYFSPTIDTLFLTFERDYSSIWDSMLEVADIVDLIHSHNGQSFDEVKMLAIDEDLWVHWDSMLREETDEWMKFGEDDTPPLIEGLPSFQGLTDLKIVRNSVDGSWKHRGQQVGEEWEEDDFVREVVRFEPLEEQDDQYLAINHGYRDPNGVILSVKDWRPKWSLPTLSWMSKNHNFS